MDHTKGMPQNLDPKVLWNPVESWTGLGFRSEAVSLFSSQTNLGEFLSKFNHQRKPTHFEKDFLPKATISIQIPRFAWGCFHSWWCWCLSLSNATPPQNTNSFSTINSRSQVWKGRRTNLWHWTTLSTQPEYKPNRSLSIHPNNTNFPSFVLPRTLQLGKLMSRYTVLQYIAGNLSKCILQRTSVVDGMWILIYNVDTTFSLGSLFPSLPRNPLSERPAGCAGWFGNQFFFAGGQSSPKSW